MAAEKETREQRARIAAKDARDKDAAKVVRDYEANLQANLAKTARLRALRLAAEAAAATAAAEAAAVPVKRKRTPKEKPAAAE